VKELRRRIRPLEREEKKKHRRALHEAFGYNGMWPLNSPGMPLPGPDFLRVAMLLGDSSHMVKDEETKKTVYKPGETLRNLYRRALREPGFTLEVKVKTGKYSTVSFVPGHIWGQHAEAWELAANDFNAPKPPPIDGPHPAEIMVVGKMPWKEEVEKGRHLLGPTGEVLLNLIKKLRIKGTAKWYVTTVCKFMPPDGIRKVTAGWLHNCTPLLQQELRIVRPKYILCMGTEASKALLGSKYTVSYMAGRVVPYTFDLRLNEDAEPEMHTSYVMTVLHPINVVKDPAQARILESNLGRFANLITSPTVDIEEKGLDHRACYTLEDALEWIEEAKSELAKQPRHLRLTAWDLEWEGQHPVNAGSYIRTIQCSWAEKKAIAFVISHPGGKTAFRDRDGKPAVKRLVKALNEFVKHSRPVGHFLVADMEWAEHIGLKLIDHCPIPLFDGPDELGKRTAAWELFREGRGWLDTAYMNHAIEETAPLGLEMLTMRYTMAPRYDIPLEDWKTKRTQELKLTKVALEGYGECPDNILLPYANYDADATRRIALKLLPLLDKDYEGNCCWEPF